jgi:hypothetical protein
MSLVKDVVASAHDAELNRQTRVFSGLLPARGGIQEGQFAVSDPRLRACEAFA